jgi:uncharacterized protein (DUF983 family)
VGELSVDEVVQGAPSWSTLLSRGLRKKCPRCGAGHLYHGWFRMKERCPACGMRFEREPGFFVGAYLINFAITEGLLFVLVMGFVFWKDQHPDAGVVVPIAVGVFLGVFAPILFYPFSRTIWSAFDVGMTPLELKEIVEAADASEPVARGGTGTVSSSDS